MLRPAIGVACEAHHSFGDWWWIHGDGVAGALAGLLALAVVCGVFNRNRD